MIRTIDQAQRERLARLVSWGFKKKSTVASSEMSRNPKTDSGIEMGVSELEGWAGIEPANTGFADPRVSHFATSPFDRIQHFMLRLPPRFGPDHQIPSRNRKPTSQSRILAVGT